MIILIKTTRLFNKRNKRKQPIKIAILKTAMMIYCWRGCKLDKASLEKDLKMILDLAIWLIFYINRSRINGHFRSFEMMFSLKNVYCNF